VETHEKGIGGNSMKQGLAVTPFVFLWEEGKPGFIIDDLSMEAEVTGRVVARLVSIGDLEQEELDILDGLEEGDKVTVTGISGEFYRHGGIIDWRRVT